MDVGLNLDFLPHVENTLVYAKPLQLYKGIDNKIKLLVRNQDQKLQSLVNTTVRFNLIDTTNNELVFSKNCQLDPVNQGAAAITLDELDINDLPAGIYNYSLHLVTSEAEQRIIYADDNYNAQGQARLHDGVYPKFISSVAPKLGPFYNNNPNVDGFSNENIMYSSVVDITARVKNRAVLQTVQYFGTNFTGLVEIQGSLESIIDTYPSSWFTISQQEFSNLNGTTYSNFSAKISLVRFKLVGVSGTLDKILYRP